MSTPAILIATVRVRPGADSEFTKWKALHDNAVGAFPGFLGSDILPPSLPGGNEWTILLSFQSKEDIERWQRSTERAEVLSAGLPIFEGGSIGEVVQADGEGKPPDTTVTEVIFSKVKPGMGDRYREWAARIQAAQAKYPGYRGIYVQPPAGGDAGYWTSILRYDTAEHLEGWMNAPERKVLLAETKDFIESEELMRLQTSFPGWVPLDPTTGEPPPNWKAAMLVLLGLFPIVMLEMRFLNLAQYGVHASLATFIGNSISVALTSFVTMPLFVKWFDWWLFPRGVKGATARGVGILCVLFALEVIVLWKLLPW